MSRKPENLIAGLSVAFLAALSADAQSFVNLKFESATVTASGVQPYGTFVPIGSALPNWTAYLGTQQVTQVGYNAPANSVASITVIGPTWNISDTSRYIGVGIIDGKYSVDLQTGANPLNPTPYTVNASIEQNGSVPATAKSILFEAAETTPLSVSFNGYALAPVALSSVMTSPDGVYYTLYGADISAWAGQTGELEFTADFNGSFNYVVLDDIAFSQTAVPEPSIVVLSAMGGLFLGARMRLSRRCRKHPRCKLTVHDPN